VNEMKIPGLLQQSAEEAVRRFKKEGTLKWL
jgi:hypothetical protein